MSFKKFSAAHNAPGKGGSADKPKEATSVERPATEPSSQPDQKPAERKPTS